MNKDEALKMEFEAWFKKQYGHKPMPNTKNGDEPHPSVYMTMFADGAWKGWKASKEALEQPSEEIGEENCHEDDGCPKELVVLQRFWRKHHQPAQEPVDWTNTDELEELKNDMTTCYMYKTPYGDEKDVALYTHPTQPLSDEEAVKLFIDCLEAGEGEVLNVISFEQIIKYANAIEKAHEIGVKE